MAAYWNRYYTPNTIEEAVALLAEYDGRARVVGGGTDLLLELQQGSHMPDGRWTATSGRGQRPGQSPGPEQTPPGGRRPPMEALVDVTRISGLCRIDLDGGRLVIGCGVTHSQIVADPRIVRGGTCLVEGCGVIGGPQVRNVATLAGNVAHALPAGDGTIGLLALNGELEISDVSGSRWIPMSEGFAGPGKSVIDRNRAVLSRLRFPATGAGEGSAFRRVMRPQGVALPMIAMAARIALVDGGKIRAARIAVGPAGPTPFLATEAMDALVGAAPTEAAFAEAAEAAIGQARLRTSRHRATEDYRVRMIRAELPLTLARAAERAASGTAMPEGVGR